PAAIASLIHSGHHRLVRATNLHVFTIRAIGANVSASSPLYVVSSSSNVTHLRLMTPPARNAGALSKSLSLRSASCAAPTPGNAFRLNRETRCSSEERRG